MKYNEQTFVSCYADIVIRSIRIVTFRNPMFADLWILLLPQFFDTSNPLIFLKNFGHLDADDAFLISPLHMTYETVYNGYMNWFQSVTTTMPYMVTVGNVSECMIIVCAHVCVLEKTLCFF